MYKFTCNFWSWTLMVTSTHVFFNLRMIIHGLRHNILCGWWFSINIFMVIIMVSWFYKYNFFISITWSCLWQSCGVYFLSPRFLFDYLATDMFDEKIQMLVYCLGQVLDNWSGGWGWQSIIPNYPIVPSNTLVPKKTM